jgi:hypothetical protein
MLTGATPIDRARFVDALREATGLDPLGEVPATLEALFDGLHDPDDFSRETAAKLGAANASVERGPVAIACDPLLSRVTVFAGDVRVTDHFTFNTHILVLGDLEVEGVITASPDHAILMVAGSVRCRAAHLVRAYLYVTGDVLARDCFFGCCHGMSRVGGDIETKLFLHDDSWANLGLDADCDDESTTENVRASLILDLDGDQAREQLEEHLALGVLMNDREGNADVHELLARIARGEQVFRAPG